MGVRVKSQRKPKREKRNAQEVLQLILPGPPRPEVPRVGWVCGRLGRGGGVGLRGGDLVAAVVAVRVNPASVPAPWPGASCS